MEPSDHFEPVKASSSPAAIENPLRMKVYLQSRIAQPICLSNARNASRAVPWHGAEGRFAIRDYLMRRDIRPNFV